MMISKTTQYPPTGLIRIDEGKVFVYHDPFGGIPSEVHYQTDVPAHHLKKKENKYICIKCNFETMKVSDLRKNKGCNMFSNKDTVK